ncbi:MAG: Maf family protein [Defluviitaleaceae bacterium]|nr:Maf family protein [Defluviitaleaceae bacterium]
MKIILASGSPRRKQLMQLAGISFEIIVSDVDETISGDPEYQVTELALRKARAVPAPDDSVIIGADTLVYAGGQVLGKPRDADEAFAMLKMLSGTKHTVYTGVAIIKSKGDEERFFCDRTYVYFHPLTDEEIHAYIATGEPFDKAGAYGVQERGAVLVDRVEGDFYTVVGLPISKLYRELLDMGALI